jgi:hypothetical protein
MSRSTWSVVATLGTVAMVASAVATAAGATPLATTPPAAAAAVPATAARAAAPVRVLARGLDWPFGLQVTSARRAVVAEYMSGEVTSVNLKTGRTHVLVPGTANVAGVGQRSGTLYAVLGGADPEAEGPAPGRWPGSSVIKARSDGTRAHALANLEKYELKHNPDGQVQFVDGGLVDTLSDPFSLSVSRFGLLVADAGANDVLRVGRRSGKVTTFFVPPTIKSKACLKLGIQTNPGTVGCDPVPTGIAVARGSIYVVTLGAQVKNAGRVYKLNPRDGRVQRVWKNLTAPTGIAVSPDGTIYVSHVQAGGVEPLPDDFDVATIGSITRISPSGKRTTAQVTMPTGLHYRGGALYATSWSTGNPFAIPHAPPAGQIVKVMPGAFH